MPCCPYDNIPFFEEAVSVIPYTPAMQAAYGPEPHLSIYYQNPLTLLWYTINLIMGTDVRFNDTLNEIIIDHGGIFTGFVKIS